MKFSAAIAILFFSAVLAAEEAPKNMIAIPAGSFVPLFKEANERDKNVSAFFIDKYPVSIEQFNDFVTSQPEFRKSRIASLFADQRYLQNWDSDVLTKETLARIGQRPVTFVSWFAAKKYCASLGKRLPTIAEWEYSSDANNPEVIDLLLNWYSKTEVAEVGDIAQGKPNKFGVHDMHGLVWEWVDDFNSVMISSDSRSKGDRTTGFFCGGGSINATDAKAYATFMRYGFRSGLKGDYSIKALGFRCALSAANKGK